jgi:hypothetical protein
MKARRSRLRRRSVSGAAGGRRGREWVACARAVFLGHTGAVVENGWPVWVLSWR